MQRVLLLIQDAGCDPVADIHPDQAAARRALTAYVEARTGVPASKADNDDGAIEAYFSTGTACYSIVGVADMPR